MKHINLTQMLQGCSKRNGMTVSASNPDGEPTVNRQSRLMSLSGKKVEKEQLSPSCLLSASFPLSFRSRYLRYAAMIFCVLVMNVGQVWGTTTLFSTDFSSSDWSGITSICSENNSDGETKNGIFFYSKASTAKPFSVSTSNGYMTFCNNNYSSNNYWIGIPISGIAGNVLNVSVEFEFKGTKTTPTLKFSFVTGRTVASGTNHPGSMTQKNGTAGNATLSVDFPVNSETIGTKGIVYIARQSSDYDQIKSITITTATYTVSYDANGGSGSMDNSTNIVSSNSFTAPSGKGFIGWNTAANGKGTSYAPGVVVSANTTLYAQWAPMAGSGTITYTLTNGSDAVSGAVSGIASISNLATSFTKNTLTITTTSKSGYCGRIESQPESYSASAYVDLPFTVASGYTFNPSAVSVQINVESSTDKMKAKVALIDDDLNIVSNELSCAKSTDNSITFESGAFTGKLYSGTVHVRIYLYGVTSKYAYIKSPITITGTVAAAAAGCAKYSFHYGTTKGSEDQMMCFSQVGSSTTYITEEWTIPSSDQWTYVGWQGGWHNDNAKSANLQLSGMRYGLDHSNTLGSISTNVMEGAKGYVQIYSDNNESNKYVGFVPSGYILRRGTDSDGWTSTAFIPDDADDVMEDEWTTPLTSFTADNADHFTYVGLKTASGYVWTNRSETRRPIFLKPNDTWKNDNAKFVMYYWDDSSHSGYSAIMTDPDGDGVYEAWIPNTYSYNHVLFGRLNPVQVDPVVNWDNKWNKTTDQDLPSDKNLFEITGGSDQAFTGSWSVYGSKGKFHIWSSSNTNNWYCQYYPHYVLTYDANGGSGEPSAQSVPIDGTSSERTVEVAVGSGMTPPTGKHFDHWDTEEGDGGTDYAEGADYTLTADATLYAQWANNQYSVTHSGSNRGVTSGTTGANAATYGTDYTAEFSETTGYNLPATITVTIGGNTTTQGTEYTWNQGTGTVVVGGDYILGDVVITVNGVLKTYTVNFASNNVSYGTVSSSSISSVPHGSTVSINGSTNALTLNGSTITVSPTTSTAAYTYAFDHWSVADEATITSAQTITATFTQTANSYDVTHTLSNVTTSSAETATFGTDYTATFSASSGYALPDDITVTIGGDDATSGTEYTWNQASGTVTIGGSYILGDIEITVTADPVITTYSVTYAKPDGATGTPPTDATAYDSGDEVTVKANTDIAKAGTTFRGWTDGTTFYLVGQKFNITSNVTLTAVLEGGSGSCYEWAGTPSAWTDGSMTADSKLVLTSSEPEEKVPVQSNTVYGSTTKTNIKVGGDQQYVEGYINDGSEITGLTIHASNNNGTANTDKYYLVLFCSSSSFSTGVTGEKYLAPSYKDDYNASKIEQEITVPSGTKYFRVYRKLKSDVGDYDYDGDGVDNGDGQTIQIFYIEVCKAGGGSSGFTVSFADGNTAPESHTTWPSNIEGVPTGKKILQPTAPTAAGYTFGGWYSDAACTGGNEINWGSMTITADKTIYAKWTSTCTAVAAPTGLTCSTAGVNSLAFSWTAASNASSYDVYLYSDEECTSPVTPTEGSPYNVSTNSATLTGLTASTTYYCQVQSKGDGTTYCAAGGTTSAQSGTTTCTSITPTWSYFTTTVGKGITLYPTIGGNTGSGTVTYSSSNTTNITNALYANTASASATITANVAANGNYCSGSVTSSSISVVADQTGLIKQSLNYGNSTAWGTPSAPATSGTYASDITSTTAIAAYGTDYTIATTSNDGNNSNDGQTGKVPSLGSYDASKYVAISFTVASGKKLNVSAIYIPVQPVSKDYNNFKAVLTDDDDETDDIVGTISNIPNGKLAYIPFSSYGSVTGNVTLKIYAWGNDGKGNNWTAGYRFGKSIVIDGETESTATLYDISTSATNGTIAVTVGGASASSAKEDATVTITATPSSGYSFSSWSVAEDDSGDPVSVTSSTTNPTTFTMPAAEVTVSATFTPNTYDITYNLNGASWADAYSAPATYTVGTGATLPVAGNMTNTGYTFGGWYDNSSLTGSAVTNISTSDYGNKPFWAKWTENTYTVTYSANGGTGDAMSNTVGHYVTLSANTYTKSGYIFAGWNTATDGRGASYSEGEEIELKANLDLYAIWATDYTITWDASPKLSGVAAKPNLGGGNYTITASVATWTGSLTTSMISAETSGVTITGVSVDDSASPKTITATFNVGATVVGDKISFTLDVPANGSYSAKSDTEDFDIDRCTGSSSGSDGVLFSAEFKDSGLGTSDICTAANTAYTFTTAELKAAPTGGSIKAFSTSNLSHMKYATNAISIAGSDGVIRIDLDNPIATNDLFTYLNVNSSSSSAYLRHTSPTTTTDQIALTVYNSKEAKVRLTSGFNEKTTLYIVRKSGDFKLHKAAVVRPAFLMLLRDDAPTSDTNLEGTDQGLTTENYLAVISGGSATFTSPSSGNLKIKRSDSKNYINFNKAAGYLKIVLNDALQEGDVIGFDSYNTNELAFTSTSTRSTSIRSSGQLYTVDASSDLKGKSTFYIWQNSGSSDYLRGLQIARSGVAGGGGGTDKITTTLTWDTDLSGGVAAETGDADFTHTVTQDKNSLGAITYSSSNTSVATVNASGKVHIAGAGNATITATMAASGCYKEATVSYNITVTDNCADVAGTISTEDLGCSGVRLTVTGHTTSGETVSYQWYKDGGAIGGATSDNYTATTAGEYYVVVTNTGDGHCAKASTNTITLEDSEAATASKIVNSWYVKNGRRTPDIALVQTENATDFTVTSGGSPITTFAGCAFYLGADGIIYLKGQQEDGSAPTGLTSGDEMLKFTAIACGGNSSELSITIHKQESTTRPSVAFVVDGTKEGAFDAENEDHSVNTELYQYLDYGADMTGAFDLTGQNVYSTVDEQAIREHYSQFDAILITDDPSTDTKIGKKSCVDAFGTMIDVRPILTMEAFVSKWGNWKAKGIDGNPESPNPRQYKMKLQCKDHAIFKGLSVGTNVETETIDGVEYWTVTMVDNTKSPYSGVADGTDTDTKPALQGFSADDVSSLLLLGEISGGSLYAGVERQEETAARLMLLGLNAKALPNALTPEGKKVIENALKYLIETDLEKVDDCSNYFTGKTSTDWSTDSNWSKGHVPHSPNVRVRILSECVINSGTYKVAEVDIATSGKSLNKAGEMTGKLTINAGAALIVGGKIRTAKAPYFNTGDLMPTTEEDLVINDTSSTAQAALIFNNDAGDTKATVNLYSIGRKVDDTYQFQYMAIPMQYLPVNPSFAGTGIYTYVWNEKDGWERRGYYDDVYAFEGLGITTGESTASQYTMKGILASTISQEIPITADGKKLNLIGNSWTAPIQISELEKSDFGDASESIEETVYIYCTGNGNTTIDGSTEAAGQWLAIPFEATRFAAWAGLKVIPSMQAFQIKTSDAGTLTLDYDKHVRGGTTDLTSKLRAPKRAAAYEDVELMRIRVADSKTHTDLYLFEGNQFSDEFDNGWEANYRVGTNESAKLYARTSIGVMSVAAMPDLEGTPVYFIPGQETEYTFTFGGSGMGYYLNDLKLKKSTLIYEGAEYGFTYEKGDAAARFMISAIPFEAPQTPTGCESVGAEAAKVRKLIINDKVYIIRGGHIYSVDGQMVK